jgi:pimeloyl-ACP methyl ester carboxylesterase
VKPENGKVSSGIEINANEHCVMYLPSTYSKEKKYATLLFFDPHAEAETVVNSYKALAEKYNCILVASVNSKNGLPIEESVSYANNMLNYVLENCSVDTSKIFAAGFSGGAKVAMAFASMNSKVKGVAYCGAALPVTFSRKITFLGFAGLRDMNYSDLVSFEESINSPLVKHYLIEWKGIHAWPTENVFEDCFVLMQQGKIENYAKKGITTNATILQKELSIKQQLMSSFASQNNDWWLATIRNFNAQKNNDLMYERLLGFISLACYSYVNNAINQHDKNEAVRIMSIYRAADPENTSLSEIQGKIDGL